MCQTKIIFCLNILYQNKDRKDHQGSEWNRAKEILCMRDKKLILTFYVIFFSDVSLYIYIPHSSPILSCFSAAFQL